MNYILFFFISISNFSFGIEVEEVISKMHKNYSLESSFSIELDYILFKGHDSKVVSERYDGKVENSEFGYYQRMDKVEYISTEKYAIQVNNIQKYIAYSFPKKRDFTEDLNSALLAASNSYVTKVSDSYVVTLYFLGFIESPFSKVQIKISSDDYLLESVDMYFINDKNFAKIRGENDFAKPHLRIMYSNYTKKPKIDKNTFELSSYIKTVNGVLYPSKKYEYYELIDQRI